MKPQSITPATALLDSLGISYSLHKYESLVSTDFGKEAASTMGFDDQLIFKTILFGQPKTAVVAISPVSHKINVKMLAAAVSTRSIEPMDPQVAQRLTGYVRGGISPFGQKKQLPTVLDESALRLEKIYVSGGRRGLEIGIAPTDLIRVLSATTAYIHAD